MRILRAICTAALAISSLIAFDDHREVHLVTSYWSDHLVDSGTDILSVIEKTEGLEVVYIHIATLERRVHALKRLIPNMRLDRIRAFDPCHVDREAFEGLAKQHYIKPSGFGDLGYASRTECDGQRRLLTLRSVDIRAYAKPNSIRSFAVERAAFLKEVFGSTDPFKSPIGFQPRCSCEPEIEALLTGRLDDVLQAASGKPAASFSKLKKAADVQE